MAASITSGAWVQGTQGTLYPREGDTNSKVHSTLGTIIMYIVIGRFGGFALPEALYGVQPIPVGSG